MKTDFTKEEAIIVLIASVKSGQRNGAFSLRETKLLKDAIDCLQSSIADKPFADSERERRAVHTLLKGVDKAQQHGGERAFSIEDANLLYDISQFFLERYKAEKLNAIKKKIAARRIWRFLHTRFENGRQLHEFLWKPSGPIMNRDYEKCTGLKVPPV